MKLGMFTSGYQYYPLERAFADAREIGYDYIELWGGHPHAYPPDLANGQIDEVKGLIDQYKIPVHVYTPEHNAYPFNYMIGSTAQRQRAVSYLKTALAMGKEMGAEYTLISTGHAGYTASHKEIMNRLLTTLKELGDYADRINTKILIEPLTHFETNVCTTATMLSYILEEVNCDALYGMCDVVVPFLEQEPISNYFTQLGDRMAHLHLVDCNGSDETHVLPGDGCMPLEEIIKQTADYGYQGMATIELVTAYLKEPYLYAKIAHDRIRNWSK